MWPTIHFKTFTCLCYNSNTDMQRIQIEQHNNNINEYWSLGNVAYEILIPNGVLQNAGLIYLEIVISQVA